MWFKAVHTQRRSMTKTERNNEFAKIHFFFLQLTLNVDYRERGSHARGVHLSISHRIPRALKQQE